MSYIIVSSQTTIELDAIKLFVSSNMYPHRSVLDLIEGTVNNIVKHIYSILPLKKLHICGVRRK